ncbi:hypothetical protein [Paenibacillus cymbidii]|uniref:hypothetical protein n=1 Tax=Paenibacillus cymbidii TaxID=1639034 RepID=UPI001081D427|nr:hypothetical protein [Paenibacillus cymbidii]
MMLGTIRWNIATGIIGFILTFLISYPNNVLSVTLKNSFYSMIIMFVCMFGFRFVLGVLMDPGKQKEDMQGEEQQEPAKGTTIDLTTPADTELRGGLSKGTLDDSDDSPFTPLNPPKLVSKVKNGTPEELTRALRQMSEK